VGIVKFNVFIRTTLPATTESILDTKRLSVCGLCALLNCHRLQLLCLLLLYRTSIGCIDHVKSHRLQELYLLVLYRTSFGCIDLVNCPMCLCGGCVQLYFSLKKIIIVFI